MLHNKHLRHMVVFMALVIFMLVSQTAASDVRAGYHPSYDEITGVIDKTYDIFATPVEEIDIDRFSEVLIDTPDFRLTAEQQTYIGQILGNDAISRAGYLTAIQARHAHLQHGVRLLKAAQEKADAEGRLVSAEELETIRVQNYGAYPPSLEPLDHIGKKPQIRYLSIEASGDLAMVVYDSGTALQEAILRRVGGQWFIASNVVLQAHY